MKFNVRPPAAALAVEEAMKERRTGGNTRRGKEREKKEKRTAPGVEPGTFGLRAEGVNRSATEARADGGWRYVRTPR